MKLLALAVAGALAAGTQGGSEPSTALSAAAASRIVVESSAARLVFDPARLEIVALEDKTSARQLFAAGGGEVYRLGLVGGKAIGSREATARRHRAAAGRLTLETEHADVGLTVECTFEADNTSPLLRTRLAVRAARSVALASVRFPILALPQPLGDPAAGDFVVAPYCDGCLIDLSVRKAFDHSINYPGAGSMQMLAAYDRTAGVYLAAHDAQTHAKTFSVRRVADRVELAVTHLPSTAPTREWQMPYDAAFTTLRPADGRPLSWEAAADLYRQWAVEQPWCRQTLAARAAAGDVPQWVVDPSLYYAYSLRGEDAARQRIDRLPLVPAQAAAWQKLLGAPATMMLMSWEKRDSWFTPDYFPPFGGEEAFRATTARLHDAGHRALVFLSGLKWTLHKEHRAPGRPPLVLDDEAEFNRRGRPSAISDADGKAAIYGEPSRDVGQHAQICPATPLAAELLLEINRNCQDLGIDCVQVDQIVGGGMPPCFHPQHTHPPGGGRWQSQAIYRLFAEMRRQGRTRSAAYAFAIEEPAEYLIPLLDVYHARDYQQGRWPRTGEGVLGVPLFTHVYHDYVLGYGGDSAHVSDKPSDAALYHQAMNLVCGKVPAVAVWTRWYEPASTDARQRRMLRTHCELWGGAAKEYLVWGRRIASPPLDVPTRVLTFTEKVGIKRQIAVPAVLHAVWQAPSGGRAAVFACHAESAVSFQFEGKRLTLQPGEALLQTQ